MSVQLVPVYQLNALPILTVQQAANAGTLQVIGGSIFRVFTAADLGIAGINTSVVNTKTCLVTNWLDLRGCNKHAFTLMRSTPGGATAGIAFPASLQIQYRLGPTDTPSPSYVNGGSIVDVMNEIVPVTSGTVGVFPATANAADVQRVVWAWGDSTGSGSPWSQALALGGNVRLIVSWSTNPVNALNFWNAYLQSQS